MTAKDQSRARRHRERNERHAAEAQRHTMAELLDVWGIPLAAVIARCYALQKGGFLTTIPARAPQLKVDKVPPKRPAADLDLWMQALNGTKTSAEICALWGIAMDTFAKRIRRLRDAGYHPEWASPPRKERAERKRPAPLPRLWPRESTPAVAPVVVETPAHPTPAPYAGLTVPPSRWCAAGLRNVLDVPWAAFEAGVRVAFGWTLQPHTLLEDDDANAVLTLFGIATRSAA